MYAKLLMQNCTENIILKEKDAKSAKQILYIKRVKYFLWDLFKYSQI